MWFRRNALKTDDKSVEALAKAESELEKVRARTKEVESVSAALKDIRTQNHFAQQVIAIMEGQQ